MTNKTTTSASDDDLWWLYLNDHLTNFFPFMEKHIGVTDTYTWALMMIAPVIQLDRPMATAMLQAAYDRLSDSPAIREPEFFALCNLLDGGYSATRN